MSVHFLQAVGSGNVDSVRSLIAAGANPNERDSDSGLTALMVCSGRGDAEMARVLLAAGADVNVLDPRAGASALHKACQGGSLEVARILVEAGAFVDLATPTTGHTPLFEAVWYKEPDIVAYLLDSGAGLSLRTHYGFSLGDFIGYALNVNKVGRDKLQRIQEMVRDRIAADEGKVRWQTLMAAVVADDLEAVRAAIRAGAPLEERCPVRNGFNDGHTPLLVASRDGRTDIVKELIKAGADVNAVEPVFGAVPLHKATYNGHGEITRALAKAKGVDLDYQGPSNGYTPLHDALWHGFSDCSHILIEAGARLDLRGHDGKLPLDIASDMFGPGSDMVKEIQSRMGDTRIKG